MLDTSFVSCRFRRKRNKDKDATSNIDEKDPQNQSIKLKSSKQSKPSKHDKQRKESRELRDVKHSREALERHATKSNTSMVIFRA